MRKGNFLEKSFPLTPQKLSKIGFIYQILLVGRACSSPLVIGQQLRSNRVQTHFKEQNGVKYPFFEVLWRCGTVLSRKVPQYASLYNPVGLKSIDRADLLLLFLPKSQSSLANSSRLLRFKRSLTTMRILYFPSTLYTGDSKGPKMIN